MVEILKKKRKVLLLNTLSPGDVMVMTAAVRDLHRAHPGEFITDIHTSAGEIWNHNPHITKLPIKIERLTDGNVEPANSNERIFKERKLKFTVDDPEIEIYDCAYDGNYPATINRSNQNAYHFIHGYAQDIGIKLGVHIPVTEYKGDIYLAEEEKLWISQIQEMGIKDNFWLIFSGGKYDFTAKWWNPDSYQKVVEHFKNRITFVQCGDASHFHPPLEGVINLVGKTSVRQLIRLMYHSVGVICPVTFAMHLAAATPMRTLDNFGKRLPPVRPCIVLAGGREPYHWESYPHHQYMHTIGALPCCSNGGCWKSRCQPVNDGDDKDKNLCLNPVKVSDTLQIGKCHTMITPQMVSERVENYYAGGLLEYNKVPGIVPHETRVAAQGLKVAHYLVDRFKPTTLLDIGCKNLEIFKSIVQSGVDAYGLHEDTKIFFLDQELPKSRISLFDLTQDFWKSPSKFDLVLASNTLDHAGRSADNLFDTMYCNLRPGGVLILTPPQDLKSYSSQWATDWVEKLTGAGLKLMDEETEKLRRLTHRVGQPGAEYVFIRPE